MPLKSNMSNAEKQSADKQSADKQTVDKQTADTPFGERGRTEIPVTLLKKEIACPHCNLAVEVPPGGLLSRFCARCNGELPETDNCGSSCFSCLKAVGASSTPCHEGEAENPLNSKKSSLNVVQRLWDYVVRRSSP